MATILIVSDELSSHLAIPMAEEGHRVIEADRSGDTLQQILHLRPDVIVMPDDWESVEGMGLLPVVRGLSEAIMIVVGSSNATRRTEALFAAADAYVEHPVDRALLLARLRTLLRRSRSDAHANTDTDGYF